MVISLLDKKDNIFVDGREDLNNTENTDNRTDKSQAIIRYVDGIYPKDASQGDYVAYSEDSRFEFRKNFFKQ